MNTISQEFETGNEASLRPDWDMLLIDDSLESCTGNQPVSSWWADEK